MRYVGRTFRFAYPSQFVSLDDYSAHRGQRVKVIRRVPPEETDSLMYEIEAADGWRGSAWPEELEP